MATDVKIDPTSRDFVDAPDGGWVEVDDSSTAVVMQLECEEGKWWGDPNAGSKNHELLRSSDPVTIDELADSSKRAMLQLVRAGVISDLVVLAVQANAQDVADGRGEIDFAWIDRASSKPADLAYSPLGGHP